MTASVVAPGRKPLRRIADLMIAATAIAEDLPLFTTNPGDYAGLEKLIRIVPVTRPPSPPEKKPGPAGSDSQIDVPNCSRSSRHGRASAPSPGRTAPAIRV